VLAKDRLPRLILKWRWADGRSPRRRIMSQQRTYYVYIMASKSRVLYVGVTGFIMSRVLRHRAGEGGEFTRRFRVHRLVYFQSFHNVGDAIARETEVKKWRREKKVTLIEERNRTWEDLAEGWGGPAEMRVVRKADSSLRSE
jgi:putative endonuclease